MFNQQNKTDKNGYAEIYLGYGSKTNIKSVMTLHLETLPPMFFGNHSLVIQGFAPHLGYGLQEPGCSSQGLQPRTKG